MAWLPGVTAGEVSGPVLAQPEVGQSDLDLPLFSPSVPVLYALEVNGGTVLEHGIALDNQVVFWGSLVDQFGC